jgi:hypothetical protein
LAEGSPLLAAGSFNAMVVAPDVNRAREPMATEKQNNEIVA